MVVGCCSEQQMLHTTKAHVMQHTTTQIVVQIVTRVKIEWQYDLIPSGEVCEAVSY